MNYLRPVLSKTQNMKDKKQLSLHTSRDLKRTWSVAQWIKHLYSLKKTGVGIPRTHWIMGGCGSPLLFQHQKAETIDPYRKLISETCHTSKLQIWEFLPQWTGKEESMLSLFSDSGLHMPRPLLYTCAHTHTPICTTHTHTHKWKKKQETKKVAVSQQGLPENSAFSLEEVSNYSAQGAEAAAVSQGSWLFLKDQQWGGWQFGQSFLSFPAVLFWCRPL